MNGIERLQDMVVRYQHRYPELNLSFGYIGNVERWGDERLWMFFTDKHRSFLKGSFTIGETDGLDHLDFDRVEKRFERWCKKEMG